MSVSLSLSQCILPWVFLPGTLCASWTWLTISFPMFSKLSAIISSIFSQVLSLSLFSFWDPYNVNVGAFNVVPEVSCHCFSFFSLLVLFCIWSCSSDFHHSVLQVIYTFFCLSYSLLFPSSVLFISVCSLVLVGLW